MAGSKTVWYNSDIQLEIRQLYSQALDFIEGSTCILIKTLAADLKHVRTVPRNLPGTMPIMHSEPGIRRGSIQAHRQKD
jgi:hypothetical protein